jgi:ABC-type nitrate/sulfonate/bicarbonate transport system substrate-binding protein
LINVGFDPRVLTEGLVDIYPVYTSNEPYTLRSWGYDVRLWDPADFGIPALGLAYVTTDAYAEMATDQLTRFMRAALRGIAYAEEHPDEAVDIVLMYTGPEADRDHMKFMLMTELQAARRPITDSHGIGWQASEQWQALLESLLTYGAVDERIDTAQAFTNRFLPEANE